MITNIVCSVAVALVTNVTERFPNHSEVAPCPDHMPGCCVMHYATVPDVDPKQKWVKTEIVKVTQVGFFYEGKWFTSHSDEIVSTSEAELVLVRKEDWIKK